MDTTEIKHRRIPFKIYVLSALRTFLDVITRLFFKLIYGNKGKTIPPIKDDILKQPAVEVAKKIRTKQVCLCIYF